MQKSSSLSFLQLPGQWQHELGPAPAEIQSEEHAPDACRAQGHLLGDEHVELERDNGPHTPADSATVAHAGWPSSTALYRASHPLTGRRGDADWPFAVRQDVTNECRIAAFRSGSDPSTASEPHFAVQEASADEESGHLGVEAHLQARLTAMSRTASA